MYDEEEKKEIGDDIDLLGDIIDKGVVSTSKPKIIKKKKYVETKQSVFLNDVMMKYLDGNEFMMNSKLGTIYRKYFKEPVRILGKNLPK